MRVDCIASLDVSNSGKRSFMPHYYLRQFPTKDLLVCRRTIPPCPLPRKSICNTWVKYVAHPFNREIIS